MNQNKSSRIVAAILVVLVSAAAVTAVLIYNSKHRKPPVDWDKYTSSTSSTAQTDSTAPADTAAQPSSADATDDTTESEPEDDTTVSVQNDPSEGDESTSASAVSNQNQVTNPDTGRILVQVTDDNYKLVVVNSTREFPSTYEPKLAQILGTDKYLDARVAPHYEEMYNAAKQDGITLTPYSAYRSYDHQKRNYEGRASNEHAKGLSWEQAYAEAAKVILPPGTSEHNLGLCMDICNVYNSFATQPEYRWLTENAYKYGFILRYPEGKEKITGVVFEPWHWRYVGTENAKAIRDSGLCLEEWLEANNIAY